MAMWVMVMLVKPLLANSSMSLFPRILVYGWTYWMVTLLVVLRMCNNCGHEKFARVLCCDDGWWIWLVNRYDYCSIRWCDFLFYITYLHLHFYLCELTEQLGLNFISIFKDFISDRDEVLGHFLILTLHMVLSIFIINSR